MRLPGLNPKRSLTGRLALAVTGAVSVSLIFAAVLSVWREVDRYAVEKRNALTAVAEVFAYGSARAAAERDAETADSSLRAIARVPSVVYAAIELLDGSVLTEQGIGLRLTRDAELDSRGDVSLLNMVSTRTLRAQAPILWNGRDVGRVVLVAETGDMIDSVKGAGLNAALAACLAVVLGVGISLHLQHSVTRPLNDLTRTMNIVRLRHDFSQRANVVSDDEVGALARTFNDLLHAVNERDRRLAEHSSHLEEEVRARTLDLSEAKHAAESANEAKSTFLATMSHEIRTPMNGVLVMAELLASADLPPRHRRYADVIARSGRSLLAIINDILDFAKVEAGKLELERVPVDPAEVADTVVTLFAERARSSGLDVASYVAPTVPRSILGDPVRLGQVIGNLVSNALKFTEAGHVAVRLEMDAANEWLTIGVEDTGIGIDPDKLSSVFSAFSQADQSTTRRFGGTGLGLSIAQRLTEAMGGAIGVESRVGVGSTFWVRIPVEAVAPAEQPPRRDAHVAPTVVLRSNGSATRGALARALRASGFEPTETAGDPSAHWILDAAKLAALGGRPRGAERVIVLGVAGDAAAEQAIRNGHADELLHWPILQADWRPLLAALADGRALARTTEGATRPNDILPRFPSARVLVADDSAVNREVAIEALARCGVVDVVVVEDGAAAVRAAAETRFDLILMDGSMPILDGFAAARTIRRHEDVVGVPRCPIVALTAHVLGEAVDAWQSAGMDGILSKPFTLKQLAGVIQTHVPSEQISGCAANDRHQVPANPIELGSNELFNLEVLQDLLGLGDGVFVERVVALYCQQAPVAFEALEDAVQTSDAPATARAAHGLKGISLNVGASKLAERLGAIEHDARDATSLPSPDDLRDVAELLTLTVSDLKVRTKFVREAA